MTKEVGCKKICTVGAVIVAYNPDHKEFAKVVSLVVNQVNHIVIVNNATNSLKSFNDDIKITVIDNYENLGIATALNQGLKLLIDKNCSHFLLLDHDSKIPNNMVTTLLNKLIELNTGNSKATAAIGPAFMNIKTNKVEPFVKYGKFRTKITQITNTHELVNVDVLITSGTLITREALDSVGLMYDELFIDYVDIEWCIRAKKNGFNLYGYTGVLMQHELGDEALSVWGIKIPLHTPIRHYYILRNGVLLTKNRNYPLNFKIINFKYMVLILTLYSIFSSNRFEHFKKMILGIKHGFKGISGKLNEAS